MQKNPVTCLRNWKFAGEIRKFRFAGHKINCRNTGFPANRSKNSLQFTSISLVFLNSVIPQCPRTILRTILSPNPSHPYTASGPGLSGFAVPAAGFLLSTSCFWI